jgi:hypothetical protein
MKKVSTPHRLAWTKKRVSNGAEYQFLNPISGDEVRFPNALHRDNFLIQFGEPDIEKIVTEAPTVSVMIDGKLVTTRFDITIFQRGGVRVLQEVKPKELIRSIELHPRIKLQLDVQRMYANLTHTPYEIRTETEIYRYPNLVKNKRRMRQILALHREDDLNVEESYLYNELLHSCSLSTMNLYVPGLSTVMERQRMEAAMYRLYIRGVVHLNFKEAAYGTCNSFATSPTAAK